MAVRQRAVVMLPTLMRALKKESPSLPQRLPSLRRSFSLYDQINLIDNVPEDQLRFQGYTDSGFTVNGVQYEGCLLCVGNLMLSWSPKKMSDITAESLSIFQAVRPIYRNFDNWHWKIYPACKSQDMEIYSLYRDEIRGY